MIGHNGGPPFDWGQYGGFVVEARDSRTHHLVGYGKQVKPADNDRGFCYSVNEAWRDLIHECRFRDGHVMNGGRKMLISRGSMVGAVSWLAYRWNWTPKTVRGFLDRLENDGMIKTSSPGSELGTQKGKQAQIITVCNYDKFNLSLGEEGQANGQAEGEQRASKGQAEGNNIRKEERTEQGNKESIPLSEEGISDGVPDALKAFHAYNELAQRIGLPLARTLTPARRKSLTARLREHGGMPAWNQALANVERSAFLRGKNDRGWRLDFDFLIAASKFTRVHDGTYGNGAHAMSHETSIQRMARLMGLTEQPEEPAYDRAAIEHEGKP